MLPYRPAKTVVPNDLYSEYETINPYLRYLHLFHSKRNEILQIKIPSTKHWPPFFLFTRLIAPDMHTKSAKTRITKSFDKCQEREERTFTISIIKLPTKLKCKKKNKIATFFLPPECGMDECGRN